MVPKSIGSAAPVIGANRGEAMAKIKAAISAGFAKRWRALADRWRAVWRCRHPDRRRRSLRLEFQHGGFHIAGANGIHPHAFWREFEGQGLGEQDNAALGGAVNRRARAAHQARVRGDVDDLAAGFFQFRNGIAAGEEGAFQIDVDGAVPLGLGHGGTFAFHPDARRIDEKIEPAETRHGFGNHVGAIGNFRDVALDGEKLRRQIFRC